MKVIYFILIVSLSFLMPQAYALDLGDTLKDVIKSNVSGKTGNDSKEVSSPDAAKNEKRINFRNPSMDEEIQIGREITGNLLGAAPLVNDAALQKYVNQVGRWVANQSERGNLPWHFGVIESEDINAFAAPGGYVVITKGLYRKLENEAQLAGVLAHEIAHVTKSHHLKILQKSQLLDLGADLLGKQLGKNNQIIQKVIGSGAEICARSLDKNAEFEADRMGVTLTARAGYEPYGLPEVLQTIGQTNKNDNSVALLFKTHPHPDDRLLKLDEAIGNRLDAIKDGKTLSNRFYKLKN
ncbi:MAG: peptidase [Deltaproteobacteria bacterium HGW-Deltaproteobacteria-7]|jgi:predicted Zn-dependent protease|nr:MAG: peptidase [Deltaproteobacteria bacterium HGW-Deltaproteobacteria-7]PKN52774.1 MAG: peptidase [Deltaproteobacteria bacterium HGW-Deltaproteobacteria-13]